MAEEEDDWCSEGFDEVDKESERQSAPRVPRRWYLPAEHSGELSFVTDMPFVFKEHNLKLDGHWKNWFTCSGRNCPLCKAGNDPYVAAVWMVVDHGEWEDSEGNQHVDEPRLFVAKTRVASRLKRIREKKKTLRGMRLEVYRSEAMAANTGDQFDGDGKPATAKMIARLKWWPKNQDYDALPGGAKAKWKEIFAPKTRDELAEVLGKLADEEEDDDKPVRF